MKHLVMIHGLLGPLEGVSPAPADIGVAVYYAHLPGYGSLQSPPPVGGVTLDGQAQAVVAQLREHDMHDVWLLGHSVGGAIAMRVAALEPGRIAGVLSVEGNFTLEDAFWCRHIAAAELASWREEHAKMVDEPAAWLARGGIGGTAATLAAARRILGYQSAETVRAVACAVVRDTGQSEFLEGVRQLIDSGLVLHLIAGERSVCGWDVPVWASKAAASFTIVPKVGHMLMLEEPEAFWAAIREALNPGQPASTGTSASDRPTTSVS